VSGQPLRLLQSIASWLDVRRGPTAIFTKLDQISERINTMSAALDRLTASVNLATAKIAAVEAEAVASEAAKHDDSAQLIALADKLDAAVVAAPVSAPPLATPVE
jgi:outer membrane murein-binding lipoprotein Lpp